MFKKNNIVIILISFVFLNWLCIKGLYKIRCDCVNGKNLNIVVFMLFVEFKREIFIKYIKIEILIVLLIFLNIKVVNIFIFDIVIFNKDVVIIVLVKIFLLFIKYVVVYLCKIILRIIFIIGLNKIIKLILIKYVDIL